MNLTISKLGFDLWRNLGHSSAPYISWPQGKGSPFSKLPLDLHYEIFFHVIEHQLPQRVILYSETLYERGYTQHVLAQWMLIRLTHVCADWRYKLISNPEFWKRVDLVPGKGPGARLLLSLFLSRSGEQPFTLGLLQKQTYQIEEICAILRTFLPYRYRWQAVAIFLLNDAITNTYIIQDIVDPQIPLTRLKEFRLHCPVKPNFVLGQQEDCLWFCISATSPQMISAHLNSRDLSIFSSALQLGHVTEYVLPPLPVHQIAHFLRIASRAKFVKLESIQPPPAPPLVDFDPIMVHALETLCYSAPPPGWLGTTYDGTENLEFLKLLTAPSLKTLSITEYQEHVPPLVKEFLQRSKCSLESLELSLPPSPSPEWHLGMLKLLRCSELETVSKFSLFDNSNTTSIQQIVSALINRPDRPCLLPGLTDITFVFDEATGLLITNQDWDGDLGVMIFSRCHGTTKLKNCMLGAKSSVHRIKSLDIALLLAAWREGLHLQWFGYGRAVAEGKRELDPELGFLTRILMNINDSDFGLHVHGIFASQEIWPYLEMSYARKTSRFHIVLGDIIKALRVSKSSWPIDLHDRLRLVLPSRCNLSNPYLRLL